jgi:hypothetical protein
MAKFHGRNARYREKGPVFPGKTGTVDLLREQLLTLPVRDRASLATLLLASLETQPLDDGAQQAWIAEAESRSLAYSQGQ